MSTAYAVTIPEGDQVVIHHSLDWLDASLETPLTYSIKRSGTAEGGNELAEDFIPDIPIFSAIEIPINWSSLINGIDIVLSMTDIDSDGDLDAIGHQTDSSEIQIAISGPSGFAINPLKTLIDSSDADTFTGINPVFADIDGDGDLDFIDALDDAIEIGAAIYTNTGTGTSGSPKFEKKQVLNATDLSHFQYSKPAFADIDNDGDLDLLISINESDGKTARVFLNTTTEANNPQFESASTNTGLESLDLYSTQPIFVDLDGDDNADLIARSAIGTKLFRNTSSQQTIQFQEITNNHAALTGLSYTQPVFVDIDQDGDLDIIHPNKGTSLNQFHDVAKIFRNESTPGQFKFEELAAPTGLESIIQHINEATSPTLDSINYNDASLIAITPDSNEPADQQLLFTSSNTSKSPAYQLFELSSAFDSANPLSTGAARWLSENSIGIPLKAKHDGVTEGDETFDLEIYSDPDSDPILEVQLTLQDRTEPEQTLEASEGEAIIINGNVPPETTGSSSIFWEIETLSGTWNPEDFELKEPLYQAQPLPQGWDFFDSEEIEYIQVVDIDDDGDLDAFAGNSSNGISVYMNEGSNQEPSFIALSADELPDQLNTYALAPIFADIDGDGDIDIIDQSEYYFYQAAVFVNIGGLDQPSFQEGESIPMHWAAFSFTSPVFADIDGDGDLDLFTIDDDYYDNSRLLLNEGSQNDPKFVEITNDIGIEEINPDSTQVTFADLDGDGDQDLITTDEWGSSAVYRNQWDADRQTITFDELESTGLETVDFYYGSPVFTDVDGDGDLDYFINAVENEIDWSTSIEVYSNTSKDGEISFEAFTDNTGLDLIDEFYNFYNVSSYGARKSLSLADFNQDGRADILRWHDDSLQYFEQSNTGIVVDSEEPLSGSAALKADGSYQIPIQIHADLNTEGDEVYKISTYKDAGQSELIDTIELTIADTSLNQPSYNFKIKESEIQEGDPIEIELEYENIINQQRIDFRIQHPISSSDLKNGILNSSFNIQGTGLHTLTIDTALDGLQEGVETGEIHFTTSNDQGETLPLDNLAFNINDTAPTWEILASAEEIQEGNDLTLIINYEHIQAGTTAYLFSYPSEHYPERSGIGPDDLPLERERFSGGTMPYGVGGWYDFARQFTTNESGTEQITISIPDDGEEESPELATFGMYVNQNQTYEAITKAITLVDAPAPTVQISLNPTPAWIAEGSSSGLNIAGNISNPAEDQILKWSILTPEEGHAADAADFSQSEGEISVQSDDGSFELPLIKALADTATEGKESFTVRIYDPENQEISAETNLISIADTSRATGSQPTQPVLRLGKTYQTFRFDQEAEENKMSLPLLYTPGAEQAAIANYNIHYSSFDLQFDQLRWSDGEGDSLLVAPVADTTDLDRDPTTNRYLPISIDTTGFTAPEPDSANSEIEIGELDFFLREIKTEDFDSVTGIKHSAINISSDDHYVDDLIGLNQLKASPQPFNLDVNNDGQVSLYTDGIMLIRKFIGLEDCTSGMSDNLFATDEGRRSREQVNAYLNSSRANGMLDFNLDDSTSLYTDGILLIRYLISPTLLASSGSLIQGKSLFNHASGVGDLEDYFESIIPTPGFQEDLSI